MARFPRLAVGTVQPGADSQAILAALLEVLHRLGFQVQRFLSRSHFSRPTAPLALTGLSVRHLDSWLMSPEVCRDLFWRGCDAADVALVEGEFASAAGSDVSGGRLEPLCRWLALPRLVVLDTTSISTRHLPRRPKMADGLLLDNVQDRRHLALLRTEMEALWKIPVLGALECLTPLRRELEAVPAGGQVPAGLSAALGDHFAAISQPQRIWELAVQRDLPPAALACRCRRAGKVKLTVAVAYDEAFHQYFPDTLDMLEGQGATVVDFSPLRHESLPVGTDLVYLGGGHPERFGRALAENHCISAALRSHVRQGGRIYAEGGGAAYLCQLMEGADGQFRPVVGLLPAVAQLQRAPATPQPVECTLTRPNWLGPTGLRLRGYRTPHWRLEPVGPCARLSVSADPVDDLVGSCGVIASLVQLNLAAQPELLAGFFHPQRAWAPACDPWASTR